MSHNISYHLGFTHGETVQERIYEHQQAISRKNRKSQQTQKIWDTAERNTLACRDLKMNDFRLFDNNTLETDIKIRKKYNFMQMNLFYDKNTIYTCRLAKREWHWSFTVSMIMMRTVKKNKKRRGIRQDCCLPTTPIHG